MEGLVTTSPPKAQAGPASRLQGAVAIPVTTPPTQRGLPAPPVSPHGGRKEVDGKKGAKPYIPL